MAGSARTVFTRLLPWVALALMTVAFFVQVRARHAAERGARKARDELHQLRADRVMGFGPQVEPPRLGPVDPPPDPKRVEASAAVGPEMAALRTEAFALREELAAARAVHQDLVARTERLEALRATEGARADALEKQLGEQEAAAAERIAYLQSELADATAELARRKSPVARWLALAEGGEPHALEVIRVETAKAASDDVQELAARWKMKPPVGGALEVATVLEHMPVSTASSLLAADLYLSCAEDRRAARVLERLAAHGRHPDTVARVLGAGTNERREDIVAHVAAHASSWPDPGRTLVRDALLGLLGSDDAWTLEIAVRGLARLRMKGYADRLLPLLTHEAPAVRIATVYALLAVSDRASAVKTLGPTVVLLLDHADFDVRMAGLFLAQELAGEKRSLAFGSSDEAVAKEVARLKAKLGALGGD